MRGWLRAGKTPSFDVLSLRQLGAALTTGPFGSVLAASEYVEGGIPLVNPTHIRDGRINPDPNVSVSAGSAERLARHRLDIDDIVVGRHGDVGRSALVTSREEGWLCGSGSIAIRSDPSHLEPRFLQWVLGSTYARAQLLAASNGATMDTINEPVLLGLGVPSPSLGMQICIADFLDTETARIDALIERKRRMVEVVGDRRSVLIERRIRALAEKWGVRPLKHSVRRVEVGIVVKPSALYSDEGVPTIRGFNVKPGQILLHDIATISEEGDSLHAKSRLRTGDVVVVRTGQAGAAAVVPPALDGYVNAGPIGQRAPVENDSAVAAG